MVDPNPLEVAKQSWTAVTRHRFSPDGLPEGIRATSRLG